MVDNPTKDEPKSDATTVADIVFGKSPPSMLPDWKAAALEAQANFALNAPGGDYFARQNNGAIKDLNETEEKEEREQEKVEQFRDAIAIIAEEEQERQRDAWSKQTHSFAGADLTGDEWGQLAAELNTDGRLNQWLIARLMKNGNSRDDAEKKAKELKDIALILSKPESEWTPEEKEKVEHGRADKDFKDVMPELKEQMLKGDHALSDDAALHSGNAQSVETRDTTFATAPDLSQHHAAALTAQKPLDAIKPLPTAPQPSEPAMGGLG